MIIGILYTIYGVILRLKLRGTGHIPSYYIPSTISTNPVDELYSMAMEFLGQERAEKAIDAFNRVLELEPNFPAAWFGLARAWAIRKEFRQVLYASREGLEIEPLNAGGLLLFGEACWHCEDYEKAWYALKTCRRIDKNNARAQDLLWEVKAKLGYT